MRRGGCIVASASAPALHSDPTEGRHLSLGVVHLGSPPCFPGFLGSWVVLVEPDGQATGFLK